MMRTTSFTAHKMIFNEMSFYVKKNIIETFSLLPSFASEPADEMSYLCDSCTVDQHPVRLKVCNAIDD